LSGHAFRERGVLQRALNHSRMLVVPVVDAEAGHRTNSELATGTVQHRESVAGRPDAFGYSSSEFPSMMADSHAGHDYTYLDSGQHQQTGHVQISRDLTSRHESKGFTDTIRDLKHS
jgi:hypothetical protein